MEGDWICGLELGLEHGVRMLWTQSGAQLVESQGGIIRRVLVLLCGQSTVRVCIIL